MESISQLFKALRDQNRLRVVAALLAYDELCACQLTELLQITAATASRHMGVLVASGLVSSRKESRWVYYRLTQESQPLLEMLDWLSRQLENDTTIKQDRKTLKEITSCDKNALCNKHNTP